MARQNIERREGAGNANFVQVNKGFLRQWRALVRKNPLSVELLYIFMEAMGRMTNACLVSQKALSELTGYTPRHIARAIAVLKEDNWVATVRVGGSTAYCVNAHAVWQAARDQKRHALFTAAIIASESEQESTFRELVKQDLKHIPFVDVGSTERVFVADEKLPPPDQVEAELS